jgi:hypothetical protein
VSGSVLTKDKLLETIREVRKIPPLPKKIICSFADYQTVLDLWEKDLFEYHRLVGFTMIDCEPGIRGEVKVEY